MTARKRTYRELPDALQAFEAWYALGPRRDLRTISNYLQLSLGTVETWSSRFTWKERARRRADQEAAEAREATREFRREAVQERIKKIRLLQDGGLTIFARADIVNIDTVAEARALLPLAYRMIDDMLRLERLELGQPGPSFRPSKDIEDMADEELDDLVVRLENGLPAV